MLRRVISERTVISESRFYLIVLFSPSCTCVIQSSCLGVLSGPLGTIGKEKSRMPVRCWWWAYRARCSVANTYVNRNAGGERGNVKWAVGCCFSWWKRRPPGFSKSRTTWGERLLLSQISRNFIFTYACIRSCVTTHPDVHTAQLFKCGGLISGDEEKLAFKCFVRSAGWRM